MEELRNLNELAKQVVHNFNEKFDARDRKIPQAFKNNVKRLKTFSVVFNDYSVIIKGDGVRSKDSYVPNQSFFMASFFIEYSYELSRYKQKIMPWLSNLGLSANDLTAFFTHERDMGITDVRNGEDKFVEILDKIGYTGADRDYLIKFVTDYDWWSGSKTIERSDFFNSPVLSIMGLSASSNAAMALIVDHLTQHPELSSLLLNQIEVANMANKYLGNLQQIFYGAPGTGKSNTIKKVVDKQGKKFYRTTFHPDSDYSTFVGAYKPSMFKAIEKSYQPILDYDSLVDKFKEYLTVPNVNITKACTLFGYDYHDSIIRIQEHGRKVMDLVNDAYKSNTSYDSVVRGGMACYEKNPINESSSKITYQFVPQAFTNAYVEAWNTEEDVYLIIEEINRGNCAQIFGDLFQLLDRKNGVSEYPIDADTDLANYINKELQSSPRTDIPADVRNGSKLMLPSNLYIWATMNTSDQSLFPIDSAFKRRWDWVYIPIKKHDEGYKIKIDNNVYDWWGFLEKINQVIGDTTSSEDKKLGYFFVKAEDKVIKADKFVSKVLFYLWNDVFKNYGFDNPIFSKGENKKFAFSDFFQQDGSPNFDMVKLFLGKLDETIDKDNSFVESAKTDTESTDD